MFCRPLAMGSLEEVFNYPLGFLTTIPGTFGLPPIEENLAEGVVVKPLKNSMIMTHKGPRRLIFKRKIEKFSERKALPRLECHLKEEQRREDEKWKGEKGETLRYEIFSLITEQRVINAITKLGQPQTKNEWNGVKNELVSDVMETLKEDNEEEWSECDPPTVQMLTNETKKQLWYIHTPIQEATTAIIEMIIIIIDVFLKICTCICTCTAFYFINLLLPTCHYFTYFLFLFNYFRQ